MQTNLHAKACLSFGLMLFGGVVVGQEPSDIYLLDVVQAGDRITISNSRNITQHPGYDNQPFFHPSEPVIYYSSFDDQGRSNIKSYDYRAKKTKLLTDTVEREYSPTVTPDGKFVSCIIQRDDGAQDLGKYPIDGGKPITLIDNLIVGYHAWINQDRLMLFVLGDKMTLRLYDIKQDSQRVIAENIGRSLHRIPGQTAMSFVHKKSDDRWTIKRLDHETQEISEITATLPGREDLTWTPDGRILMSDGARVFIYDPNKTAGWKPIVMEGIGLTGITRLAISPDSQLLAVVADE